VLVWGPAAAACAEARMALHISPSMNICLLRESMHAHTFEAAPTLRAAVDRAGAHRARLLHRRDDVGTRGKSADAMDADDHRFKQPIASTSLTPILTHTPLTLYTRYPLWMWRRRLR
jgi:hypothetical protein